MTTFSVRMARFGLKLIKCRVMVAQNVQLTLQNVENLATCMVHVESV